MSTEAESNGISSDAQKTPAPTELKLHRVSRVLEVSFADEANFHLPAEYLRTHSPSAEVQQHGNPILVTGKEKVAITRIEPVGQYAVRLHFSDGHDTGLFTWQNFYQLGQHQAANWQSYCERRDSAEAKAATSAATGGAVGDAAAPAAGDKPKSVGCKNAS